MGIPGPTYSMLSPGNDDGIRRGGTPVRVATAPRAAIEKRLGEGTGDLELEHPFLVESQLREDAASVASEV